MVKYLLLSFFSLLKTVHSFTNGTLLPSYLCGRQGDGYPKSVGTLIPYLKLGNVETAYNQFAPGAGSIPILINNGENNILGNALAPNAQQIIGSFHNGKPETDYITPLENPIVIVPTEFTNFQDGTVSPNFIIKSNSVYKFSLVVNSPFFNAPDIALDGAFVYALDIVSQERIGEFLSGGDKMAPWYACTLNGKFPPNTGIVHTELLVEAPIYNNIIWKAPKNFKGDVMFIGAGVTDDGFGPFKITYRAMNINQTTINDFVLFISLYLTLFIVYITFFILKKDIIKLSNTYINILFLGLFSIDCIILFSIYTTWYLSFYFFIYSKTNKDELIKTMGTWNTSVLSLLILPSSRYNVIFSLIPYRNNIFLHKYVSVTFIFSIIVKIISVYVYGNPIVDIFMMGFLATFLILFVILFSNKYKILHKIFTFLAIIFVSIHNIISLYYIIPSMVILGVDIIIRLTKSKKPIHVKLQKVNQKFNNAGIFITLTVLNSVQIPVGSYFYVCIEDISKNEYQPLSVLSQPTDDTLQFFVKNKMENNTWKNTLNNLEQIKHGVYIKGPYKNLNVDYTRDTLKHIICIAAGTGIIPIFSIIEDIQKKYSKKIYIVWIMSSSSLIEPFEQKIKTINNIMVDIDLYITDSNEHNTNLDYNDINIIHEKPSISKVVNSIFKKKSLIETETICLCSGPKNLCENAIIACSKLNIEVSCESL